MKNSSLLHQKDVILTCNEQLFGTLFINWYVKLSHCEKNRLQVDIAYIKIGIKEWPKYQKISTKRAQPNVYWKLIRKQEIISYYVFVARQNVQQKPRKLDRGNELIIHFEDITENFHSCIKYNGQHLRKQQKIRRETRARTSLKTRMK